MYERYAFSPALRYSIWELSSLSWVRSTWLLVGLVDELAILVVDELTGAACLLVSLLLLLTKNVASDVTCGVSGRFLFFLVSAAFFCFFACEGLVLVLVLVFVDFVVTTSSTSESYSSDSELE